MSKPLSFEQLYKAGASADTIHKFRTLFGNTFPVTWRNCLHFANVFDFRQLACLLLSPADQITFRMKRNRRTEIVRAAYTNHTRFVNQILKLESEQPLALAASQAEYKRILKNMIYRQNLHDAGSFAVIYTSVR